MGVYRVVLTIPQCAKSDLINWLIEQGDTPDEDGKWTDTETPRTAVFWHDEGQLLLDYVHATSGDCVLEGYSDAGEFRFLRCEGESIEINLDQGRYPYLIVDEDAKPRDTLHNHKTIVALSLWKRLKPLLDLENW